MALDISFELEIWLCAAIRLPLGTRPHARRHSDVSSISLRSYRFRICRTEDVTKSSRPKAKQHHLPQMTFAQPSQRLIENSKGLSGSITLCGITNCPKPAAEQPLALESSVSSPPPPATSQAQALSSSKATLLSHQISSSNCPSPCKLA